MVSLSSSLTFANFKRQYYHTEMHMKQVSPQSWFGPYFRYLDFKSAPTYLAGTHTKALTDSAPTSLVGIIFLQGLLLKVSHKPSRTGLQ